MGARLRLYLIFAADFLSTPVFSRRAVEPPGEYRLTHLALPFHLEQERLFHQLPQCLFREARLIITRDSILQIAHGNGRRIHIPLPF